MPKTVLFVTLCRPAARTWKPSHSSNALSMASLVSQRGFLASYYNLTTLLLVLLVLLLVTSIECKEPSQTPIHHSKQRPVAVQVDSGEVRGSGAGEQRGLDSEGGGEFASGQWLVNKGKSSMAAARPTVKSWPDLVGLDAEEAKKKILEEHPNMVVQIVPEGSAMTMDYNLRRVRIHKNKDQKVTQAPRQG